MTYLGLDGRCWGGNCQNLPADESGLCDDCLEGLVANVERADWRFE
jgi:hypothetical protein